MNAHQLDAQGVIINTIVVDSLDILPNLVSAAIGGGIGDTVVDGVAVPKAVEAVSPQPVPRLDARLTLINAGKMAAVKAHLATIPGIEGEKAIEYFEHADTWRRDHPLVLGIPADIMTDAEKDALFIAAGALNA